ncbi:hypothetical protein RF11_13561 [Thelohanellus kitauei]|uniref:Uncharacterized protein n=1 Tax=Thelohanellus kitauei TaxID=669202 RepID=A0A0C2JI02_THEKT|nr:hypothetical protein RF11_13561 [Thelohanellus kitauei]
MEAVRIFVSHFFEIESKEADTVFVKNFPTKLFDEFWLMSHRRTNVDGYHEKITLCMQTFTFLFRNTNFRSQGVAERIIWLFLKSIKAPDPIRDFDARLLMDSIVICVGHIRNQIMFIEENGPFHVYYFFQISTNNLLPLFWNMCQHVYNLDYRNSTTLLRINHSSRLNQLMTKYTLHQEENCALILFIVLRMLVHVRLLYSANFNITQFFVITVSICQPNFQTFNYRNFFSQLSKIWTVLLRGFDKADKIASEYKLITISAIFAIDLLNKLRHMASHSIELNVTENKKQRLYIIYFTLISSPIIDEDNYPWLRKILEDLHAAFQNYFEKFSIQNLSFENKFPLLQYFIKSHVTLHIGLSHNDQHVFTRYHNKLKMDPSLSKI